MQVRPLDCAFPVHSMNPDAHTLWRGPRWTLALLLAGLGTLGPFSIDTYLPAFAGIAASVGATPVQMQQTLSSYLLGFAVMNLFHGALSDSLGRRPLVLGGMALFTLASVGCALSDTIGELVFYRALQGMSAGAGMVVSRAIIRDMFPPVDAQRVMSQVTLFFGIAPAVAPMVGGLLFVHADWHAIFWFLAAVGAALGLANWRWLPETLHATARQPFNVRNLMRGYWQLVRNPRFLALVLASGIPFNGMFMYVLAAPVFLGEHLRLQPTQFFWFFTLTIGGIMAGAWLSGRLAGRDQAAAPDPARPARHAGGGARQRRAEPAVGAALGLGHAADRGLQLRLVADGAGGHAAGAGPGARPPRHGVFGAVLPGQPGQRRGGRRPGAAGDALHAGAGRRLAGLDRHRPRGLDLGQAAAGGHPRLKAHQVRTACGR